MPDDPDFRISFHRKQWSITWTDRHGVRKRKATGKADRKAANEVLDETIKEYDRAQVDRYTVGELWELYRASLGARPSATTMGFEWRALEKTFGSLLPSQITEGICLKYATARIAAGRSAGTVWTELGRLRMTFAHAVKRNLLTKAPYIPRPQQPKPRGLYLRPSEIMTLLDTITSPHVRLFVTLAWSTGSRASALLELEWPQIDFDRGMINLAHPGETKRMKGRAVVPMNETARAALVEARRSAITPYVIEYNRKPVGSVKKALKAAGGRAGCPWIHPHAIRHSVAVCLAEAGISMSEIGQLLGHTGSGQTVTERVYARFSPDYLRKAVAALELGGSETRLRVVG